MSVDPRGIVMDENYVAGFNDGQEELKTELDRLRSEIDRLRTPWRVQLDSYRAENNRLRTLNAELVDAMREALELIGIAHRRYHPDWDGSAAPTSVIGKCRTVLAKAKEQP